MDDVDYGQIAIIVIANTIIWLITIRAIIHKTSARWGELALRSTAALVLGVVSYIHSIYLFGGILLVCGTLDAGDCYMAFRRRRHDR